MLQSIKLNNFELFKSAEVNLEKINIISGTNLDDTLSSSNGSGKSTLAKNSILYGLYGDVPGVCLKDLIRIGEKEASVELIINKGNDTYKIVRKIPNELHISLNDKEADGNTPTIKQRYLDGVFGDLTFFRKFRMIDSQGINLLDMGITSLRKELMNFCDDLFTNIRKKLLAEKLNRETYSIDKRLYKFSLSKGRLSILEKGTQDLKNKTELFRKEINELQTEHTQINSEYLGNKNSITSLSETIDNNLKSIQNNERIISESNQKCTFDADTSEIENEQSTIDSLYQSLNEDKDNLQKEIQKLNIEIRSFQEKTERNAQDYVGIQNEVSGLDNVEIGTRCDKCGSIVNETHKEQYKKDLQGKMKILDSKQLELRDGLHTSEILLLTQKDELKNLELSISDLKKNLDDNTKLLKTLNNEKTENAKYNTLIETYTKQNITLTEDNVKLNYDIEQLNYRMGQLNKDIIISSAKIELKNKENEIVNKKLQKTQEYLLKLREAFKFIDYKYSQKDVLLYDESIKILDSFAGFFINEWLKQLAIVINNLLKNVNMQVEFNAEKDFIKIKNSDNELKFEQLSSGQRTFLSSIFKLAILLHRGENEGIIICDEGLSAMDEINFLKFIEICKTLPFQVFLIFHGLKTEIDDINKINIVRQNGESHVE